MKLKYLLLSLILLLVSISSYSQEPKKIGLSGSLQDNQFGILIPIWMGEKFVLAPAFDLKIAEKAGTDFAIALVPRFYFSKEKLSPYFGLKFGTFINKPYTENDVDPDTKLDILGGLAFGGEYFLSEHFSFGVEVQANLTKSDDNSYRFGNPGKINFNTGTMIAATVYF